MASSERLKASVLSVERMAEAISEGMYFIDIDYDTKRELLDALEIKVVVEGKRAYVTGRIRPSVLDLFKTSKSDENIHFIVT